MCTRAVLPLVGDVHPARPPGFAEVHLHTHQTDRIGYVDSHGIALGILGATVGDSWGFRLLSIMGRIDFIFYCERNLDYGDYSSL